MKSYLQGAGKNVKDGVRRETPPFWYINGEKYLGKHPKWSEDTLGISDSF